MTRRFTDLGSSPRKRLFLAAALAAVGVAACARLFDRYEVPTGSMEPLLHGHRSTGDRVLVRRSRGIGPRLRRFDVAVFSSPDGAHCVKRLGGLPGESVQILEGDLYVGGAIHRKDDRELAATLVPLFDSAREPLDRLWVRKSGLWTERPDGWEVDVSGAPEDSLAGLCSTRVPLLDDYLDPAGRVVRGAEAVRDLAVEIRWTPLSPGGSFRVELLEDGDRFTFVLDRQPGETVATLRRFCEGKDSLLSRGVAPPLREGDSIRIEAENVDNRLRLRLDGRDLFPPFEYERNSPYLPPGRGVGPSDVATGTRNGVIFGVSAARALLQQVILRRDLHYTKRGDFGVSSPARLGPNEYFFLGDNSGESLDCREWGPIDGSAMLGVPVLIYWPVRRMRWF